MSESDVTAAQLIAMVALGTLRDVQREATRLGLPAPVATQWTPTPPRRGETTPLRVRIAGEEAALVFSVEGEPDDPARTSITDLTTRPLAGREAAAWTQSLSRSLTAELGPAQSLRLPEGPAHSYQSGALEALLITTATPRLLIRRRPTFRR